MLGFFSTPFPKSLNVTSCKTNPACQNGPSSQWEACWDLKHKIFWMFPKINPFSGKYQFLPFSKRLETVLKGEVMGSGKNQFLPLEVSRDRAERSSYGKWQEPVLAT